MNQAYNYSALSPKDLEDLLGDLLAKENSCNIQTFKAGPDGGIDLKGISQTGERIIGQAKHYIGSSFSHLQRACSKENERAEAINEHCDRYILATTQSLSISQKQALLTAMSALPISEADILGADDISFLLRKHQSVERAHFKLWLTGTATLERLLYGRLYSQGDRELESIEAEMCRFVRHKGVDEAYRILRRHGRLVISGPPGIGKTTLARMICSLHVSEDWELSVAHSVEEVGDALGLEGRRVILFDDFLGQVRLSDSLLQDVDARLPSQLQRAMTAKNIRLIITTRDYILKGAQSRSEKLSRSINDDETFILSLERYSFLDRARILYNHIFFSNLSQDEVHAFIERGFYRDVVNHENYNPRIIQTITDADYTRLGPNQIRGEIRAILDTPELLWSTPYHEHISDASQLLALAVAVRSWRRPKGIPVSEAKDAFSELNRRLEYGLKAPRLNAEFRKSVKHLEGNFLTIADEHISLPNPGVRDFLEKTIIEDGIAKALLQSSSSVTELKYLRSLASDFVKAHARLWYEAFHRIFRDDDYITLNELGTVINALRFVDPTLDNAEHAELLRATSESYTSLEDLYGELDGVGDVLGAIDDGLMDEVTSAKVLAQLERDLQIYVENDANSKWASSMDDIEWVARSFFERRCTTDEMKNSLGDIIERVLDNISDDFSEMSNDDILREKDLAEELEGYLLESRSQLYMSYTDIFKNELEDRSARDQYMEDMYSDGYYRNPTRSAAVVASRADHGSRPMDEAEQAHSMFQSLKAT